MTARGRHEKPAGTPAAKESRHIPTHGGPQTGNGIIGHGSKPRAAEIKSQGTAPGHHSRLRIPLWLGGK